MIVFIKKEDFWWLIFKKNNSNTFSQPMILASILFVFAGPLGAFLGVVIGLLLGRKLDKNGN